jgi:putative nucleotidyltransferase with HDIG domain
MIPDMTIWEAYEAYTIMPNLRLHQLRVAAVARTLAKARGADVEMVTRAGLLHDMGNIMKSDLTQFPPEFYGDKDESYWQAVKDECGLRYGMDEHTATAAIAREIGVEEKIVELIDSMGFSRAERVLREGSLELQILEYADQRVAPYGITSLTERLKEGHERYKNRVGSDYAEPDREFEKNHSLLIELEQRLFDGLSITPESLTEESLRDTMESLKTYVIV